MSLKLMSNTGLKRISNSSSPEETEEIGRAIARLLPKKSCVCFQGDLGAGKTTLIKGIAAELTGLSPYYINSPTFTYLNIYEGLVTIYHFDCYRLTGVEDFQAKGLDEYFDELCFIEWPQRIASILPSRRIEITLEHLDQNKRKISYEENPF